jgi:hypothetical protein
MPARLTNRECRNGATLVRHKERAELCVPYMMPN